MGTGMECPPQPTPRVTTSRERPLPPARRHRHPFPTLRSHRRRSILASVPVGRLPTMQPRRARSPRRARNPRPEDGVYRLPPGSRPRLRSRTVEIPLRPPTRQRAEATADRIDDRPQQSRGRQRTRRRQETRVDQTGGEMGRRPRQRRPRGRARRRTMPRPRSGPSQLHCGCVATTRSLSRGSTDW